VQCEQCGGFEKIKTVEQDKKEKYLLLLLAIKSLQRQEIFIIL
jgi:hypothetical protein